MTTPHKLVDGVQIPLTQEEIAQRQAEETAWNNGAKDRAIENLRQKRDNLLKQSDWEILKELEKGNTISTAMKTYRQDLRDLPSTIADDDTASDVDAIVFPTKP